MLVGLGELSGLGPRLLPHLIDCCVEIVATGQSFPPIFTLNKIFRQTSSMSIVCRIKVMADGNKEEVCALGPGYFGQSGILGGRS